MSELGIVHYFISGLSAGKYKKWASWRSTIRGPEELNQLKYRVFSVGTAAFFKRYLTFLLYPIEAKNAAKCEGI